MAQKSRNWCFTINNWQNLPELVMNGVKSRLSAAKYWVMGKEVAPETGTQHLQGFVITHNQVRFGTIQAMLEGTGAHIEECQGTAEQNEAYCKKGEQTKEEWRALRQLGPNYGKNADWTEHGIRPASQKRKGEAGGEATKAKFRKIGELAKEGKMDEIQQEFPREYLVMYRTLKTVRMDNIKKTETIQGELEHEWLHGISGAGKSSRARRENPDLYLKDVDSRADQWWDMYEGEDVVLIEDLSPFNRSMTDALKKWSDRYPFKAQVKGGYMQIRPKKIIVTSQYTIDEIWDDEKTRAAMHRRFTEIEVDPEEEEEARREERERITQTPIDDGDIEL